MEIRTSIKIEYPDRLLNYLGAFGRANFYPLMFLKRGVEYATIELETAVELAEGLEKEINSQLTLEGGAKAYLRFVAHSDLGKIGGRAWHRYQMEVVPHDENLSQDEIEAVTKEYLHRLPKVIRNYRKKKKRER